MSIYSEQRRVRVPTAQGKKKQTHLTSEALPFLRLQEAVVHLVGTGNYRRHRVLVAGGDNGEEREGGQGQVVHAAGHAALVVAVGVQAGGGGTRTHKNCL